MSSSKKIYTSIFLGSAALILLLAKFSFAQEGKPPTLPLPEMQKLSKDRKSVV